MKKILRHFAFDTFSLWLVSRIATGMVFEKGTQTLLLAGIGLTVASLLAKPIINILILPINLVTFGVFRWISSAIVLYIVTLLVSEFKIASFSFPGFFSKWIDIPGVNVQGLMAFVIFSFLLSLISSVIYWLAK